MRFKEFLTNFNNDVLSYLDAKDLNKLKIITMERFDNVLTMQLNRELKNRNSHSVFELIMKNNEKSNDENLQSSKIDIQTKLQELKKKMHANNKIRGENNTSLKEVGAKNEYTYKNKSINKEADTKFKNQIKSSDNCDDSEIKTRKPKYRHVDKLVTSLVKNNSTKDNQVSELTMPTKFVKKYNKSKDKEKRSQLFNRKSPKIDLTNSEFTNEKLFKSVSKSPKRVASSKDKEYWAQMLNTIIKKQYESSPTLNKKPNWKHLYNSSNSKTSPMLSQTVQVQPNLDSKRQTNKPKPFRFSKSNLSTSNLQDSHSNMDYMIFHTLFKRIEEIEIAQRETMTACGLINVAPDESFDFLRELNSIFNTLSDRLLSLKRLKAERLTVDNSHILSELDLRIDAADKFYKETLEVLGYLEYSTDLNIFLAKVVQSSNNALFKYFDKKFTNNFLLNVLVKFTLTNLVKLSNHLKLSLNNICREPQAIFQHTSQIRRFIKETKNKIAQNHNKDEAIAYLTHIENVTEFLNEVAKKYIVNKKEREPISKAYYNFPIQKNLFRYENLDLFVKIKHNYDIMISKLD